jgi:hypothetical protein
MMKEHNSNNSPAQLPSNLSQKLIDEAVRSGIHQGDLLMEIMGNIIARRVSDGIESGVFQERLRFKVRDVIAQLFPRYFADLSQSEQQKQIKQMGEINDADDLTRFIDRMVSVRLQHDKQLIENRQNQEKVKQLEQKRKKRQRQEKLDAINSWFFISLISLTLLGVGVLVGINILPSGVVCPNNHSPCYWLRFDEQKVTIDSVFRF